MRILAIYNGIYPGGMAMSNRLHLYCKALISNGVDVEIVAPSSKNISNKNYYDGVKYFYFKDPIKFRKHIFLKINNFFAAFIYARYCFLYAQKYDILFIPGFGWLASLLMITSSHLGGAKVVLEVNENPYIPEGGRLDPIWWRKINRQLILNITYRFTDGFTVISKPLEQLVKRYKKKNAQIVRIPIITDKTKESSQILSKIGVPFILYTGALSETKDGVEAMFHAFAKAAKKTDIPIKFILTNKIAHKKLLQKIDGIVKANKLEDRVVFLGHIPKTELEEYRHSCLTTIINKPVNNQNLYNFPTKLGEFLSYSIPVITTSTGEMGSFVKDNETAFIIPPNDVDAIAEKILFILINPDEAFKVGNAGKALAEKEFYFMNHAHNLVNFFMTIAKQDKKIL
jgi:glycosyltransferase involved in cell wall biosynthesis